MDWKALGKAVATVAAIGAIAWTIVVAEHLFGGVGAMVASALVIGVCFYQAYKG